MRSREFLEEIRRREGLRRAVLKKIEVSGREVTFDLLTDMAYTQDDVAYAAEVAARYVPSGYRASARVRKSVPDAEGVRRAVLDILKNRFPAVAAFVAPNDVEAAPDGEGGRFFITADENDRALVNADGVIDEVHRELERAFCGAWYGELRFRAPAERGEVETNALPPAEPILAPRCFAVTKYGEIDGGAPSQAVYIEDLAKETRGVCVCGRLTYFEERLTKTGKPYFAVGISDGTGNLRCSYFTKKATLEKVRQLKEGDGVCLTGDYELFNGALSFRVKQIDRGEPPQDFVPEARPSKPVPTAYKAVFPAPAADLVQGALFGEDPVPETVRRRTFVVVDLETTGLNTNAGGMDRIIEIGAVKIADGKISERFTSFVACPARLSEEIVRLTGITDDMLVGAPPISDAIADFYRFCSGAELVAHNGIMFDFKFIRYYGEREGYRFDHRVHDTLNLAQQLLRLSNYKLDTIANYYGFTFNHHRAFDDAFVTAKIFLELVKKQGGL